MAPLNTTRTLFEVRVGAYHTIEVLLQIRLTDISWWNSNCVDHERQLHKLLGRRVLPVECREEIEEFLSRRKQREERSEANEAHRDGKKNTVAGEDNLKKKASRKRGNTNEKKKDEARLQKKQKIADKTTKYADDTTKEKKLKKFQDPGTWVLDPGYTIQLCYKMEDIEPSSATTLVFRPNMNTDVSKSDTTNKDCEQRSKSGEQTQTSLDDNQDKKLVPLASFRTWTKLKKRVNVWVFKLDTDNPCDLKHSECGGFPRPDLLPMADIFRTIGGDE